MSSFQISVPSKTFLLGEYVVLHEGPGIVLTTSPRFTLVATKNKQKKMNINWIPPASPASKFIQNNTDFFQHYQITFIDPYQGIGGFGASGAQFVMVTALKQYVDGKPLNDNELLEYYKKFAWNGEGIPPSGVDLIAQLHGGCCYFYKLKKQLSVFSWPFSDLEYGLIHTRKKLATHVHLKQLTKLNTSKLEEIVSAGLISLEQKNSHNFISAIKNYAEILQEKNLVAESTQKILKQLSVNPDILAAKGCGALGEDVILVIFDKKTSDSTISWLKEKNLHLITYGQEVANGLEVQKLNTKQEVI